MSETEYLSDSSCSSYESELEEELGESFSTLSLEPYRFEPTKVSSSATNSVEETNEEKKKHFKCSKPASENRCGTLSWCTCTHCHVELREIDCLCCKEVEALEESKFEVLTHTVYYFLASCENSEF